MYTMIGKYAVIFVCLEHVLFCKLYAQTGYPSTTTVKPLGNNVIVKLENGVDAPDKVSYVEGTGLNITCISDSAPTLISWTKQLSKIKSGTSLVLSLTLPSVRKKDAGLYTCEVFYGRTVYKRLIYVDILYQPGFPDIQGPGVVMVNDPFTLTCKVDSKPDSSYWWTFDERDNASVKKRGETFDLTVYESVYAIAVYCWAESTMFPTVGAPVTRKAYGVKRIFVHEHAYVWRLQPTVYVNIGENVYIKCEAAGQPDPKVYFTKQDDPSFAQSGPALIAYNVRFEFAGLYACNAENTVSPTDFDKQFTTQRMYTRVIVRDPNIPSNCSDFCLPGTNLIDCSGNQCDLKCSAVMIIAIASGWLAAVVVIAAGLILFLRKKRAGNVNRTSVKGSQIRGQINNQSANNCVNFTNNIVPGSTDRQPQRVPESRYEQKVDEYASAYVEIQGLEQQRAVLFPNSAFKIE